MSGEQNLGTGLGLHYKVTDEHAGVVIPNPNFMYLFSVGKFEQGQSFKMRYIVERWEFLNEHMFGGLMTLPRIELANKTRTLGFWYPGLGVLEISKNLFQIEDESTVLGTLAHEMAHEFESRHRMRPYGEDCHGPTWQLIMTKIGLPVDAKYTGPKIQAPSPKTLAERLKPCGCIEITF